ncbi:UNVERIFIED_ORG: hypothetical protein B2H98_06895 [Clostridium botulinum]|uniref:Head decoration protein n=1 Tax=Clostridium botulinum TaxID=1491 RepID=A0A846JPQ3_CLOBO|nr:hypothetical protein [Clostridium botulinum]KAI3346247.1 hypothetical protein CIT18_14495 [Clostridium botulinum]KOM88860.1 hypothetical protein ACP51_06450 [Clostridium botulinum]KOR57697.1 hypothetical protein ADT22_13140 [Clostridium botulinum]NFE13031.1 hypothetical protein [Clostridium botulinum]NFE85655.1 hypothetical protein [Clostridium botulinum]
MHQSSYTIGASHKKLRLIAGDHFITLPIKIKKADVKAYLNSDEVLEAGILISVDGKVAVTTSASGETPASTTAHGILYKDINFKNSVSSDGVADNATEIASVMVHGAVYESAVKLDKTNGAIEKAAMPMIIFGR